MRGHLPVITIFLAVLLGLPAGANEKPPAEFQQTMKDLGTVNNRLRNNLKTLDYAAIEKDAVQMKTIFTDVLEFWEKRKADDAVKLAREGLARAEDLERAAKAQDHPGVVTAQAAISGSSSSGEIGAIGVCAPCHTAHRVRLPDGTYEIK